MVTEPGPGETARTGLAARPDDAQPLFRGSVLLVLATLACTVFAFLAAGGVGDKDFMFLVAFVFLGLVTVGIFAIAWIDASSRQGASGER